MCASLGTIVWPFGPWLPTACPCPTATALSSVDDTSVLKWLCCAVLMERGFVAPESVIIAFSRAFAMSLLLLKLGLSSVRVRAARIRVGSPSDVRRKIIGRSGRTTRHAPASEAALRRLAGAARRVRDLATVVSLRRVQVLDALGQMLLHLRRQRLRVRMSAGHVHLSMRVWIRQFVIYRLGLRRIIFSKVRHLDHRLSVHLQFSARKREKIRHN